MQSLFRSVLFLCGLIHLLPFALAFMPDRIASAYGVEVSGSDMALLLRHRAVLFGIVGAIMVHSSLTRSNYLLATLTGLVSMLSFVWLFMHIGGINDSLRRIMLVDMAASLALAVTAVFFLRQAGRAN